MGNENRDDLAGRVAKMERELRWWRRCGFLLTPLGVAVLMGMGMAAPDSLRVKSLSVVDDKGQIRANMAVNDSAGVAVNVYSREGNLRGTLGVTGEGAPNLSLYGRKNGKPFVQAYVAIMDGEPVISLLDRDGETLFRAPKD
jgi:hypothetical protein